MATGLRLGMPLCQPHTCQQRGTPVDCLGIHGLHCRKSVGRHPRHSAINDLVKRSPGSAKITAHLEPAGICRLDGKRPDRATVLPWRSERILVWDATCPDTFAPSHLDLASQGAGTVADQAEARKKANMRSWPPPIISSHWRWKPLVFSVRRRRCSFVSLAAASKMSQASPRPANTCCREFQWLCSGGTRR